MSTKRNTLLVVDDNKSILAAVKMLMDSHFHRVITIATPNQIPSILRENSVDVVLLDMNFTSAITSGGEGLFWLKEIKKIKPQIQVVLFTAYADIQLAVNGIKEGAFDFIVKPWDNSKLIETLNSAYNESSSNNSNNSPIKDKSNMFWGESSVMLQLRRLIERVSRTDANILITGENGTGKEMLANEIHRLSLRNKSNMVPVDMGAITETLFESELFGHVKGAFTDARADRPGKFEVASGGTLFLDEIGNLSYHLQAKLLTAIQRRSITRVGSNAQIPIDIRLICATNRNLQQMVKDGAFREDLLYRINTIHIELPSLRERKEDIVPLAEMFLNSYAKVYGKKQFSLSEDACKKLTDYPWMGNIRELQHTMEKTVIMNDVEILTALDIDCPKISDNNILDESTSLFVGQTIEEMEYNLIKSTIEQCEGNLTLVAQKLGISRQTLYNKLKRYGL